MNKRVLIIGAGASKELRYPLGIELIQILQQIAHMLENKDNQYNTLVSYLKQNETQDFFNIAKKICKNLNSVSVSSIDTYASNVSNEKERNVIKSLIISIIRQHEGNILEIGGKSWYKNIVPLIFPPLQISDNDIDKVTKIRNKLKDIEIVSFNYDVSLEKFLYEYLVRVYSVSENGETIFNEICKKIYHVYGSVVDKEDIYSYVSQSDNDNSFKYGGNSYNQEETGDIYKKFTRKALNHLIFNAAYLFNDEKYNSINIMRENEKLSEELLKITDILLNIERKKNSKGEIEIICSTPKESNMPILYILGFGFDQDNIDRIQLNQIDWGNGCFVTNYKKNQKLERTILNTLSRSIKLSRSTNRSTSSTTGEKFPECYKIPVISHRGVSEALENDFSLYEKPQFSERILTNLTPYMALKNS